MLVRGRTRLVELDYDLRDVGGRFEPTLETLQLDSDALGIPKRYAGNAAGQRNARADHAIGARKIADIPDVLRAPDQLAHRGTRRETDAKALHGERIVSVIEGQDSPAAARPHDNNGFCDGEAN